MGPKFTAENPPADEDNSRAAKAFRQKQAIKTHGKTASDHDKNHDPSAWWF